MIMGLCKRVMVLGLVLEMLLAMTAVEEGRHVELECYDSWKVGSMQGTKWS